MDVLLNVYQVLLASLYFLGLTSYSSVDSALGLKGKLKGIDRSFGGAVESILIRSVFVNWRLGKIFFLILYGFHHKISKKLLYAA